MAIDWLLLGESGKARVVGESGGSNVFLRGGGRNAPADGGRTIGGGTCLIVDGFVERSRGAGGDGGFLDREAGRLDPSDGLGGGTEF